MTDSTANIEASILDEFEIEQVSLSVNFSDVSYRELEIPQDKFYRLLDESPILPSSSQPSPAEFYEVFKRIVEKGNDIVCIFLSKDFSGTCNSATQAKQLIQKEYSKARIEILDSRTTIMAMGYSVIEAAKAAKKGETMDNVIKVAKNAFTNSRLYFVPKTLEYLNKGGRINDAAALLGTLLKVKPILTMIDGKVAVHAKVRTFEKSLLKILIDLEKTLEEHVIKEVTIHHVNDYDAAVYFAEKINRKLDVALKVRPIAPVIGLHVGPGTLGVAYLYE